MSDISNTADERPRPQYGEYATPEEQLAHIQRPSPEQITPSELKQLATVSATIPAESVHPGQPDPAAIAAGRERFNRLVTIVFLAYGFVEVFVQVPGFLNLGVLINSYLTSMGSALGVNFETYVAGHGAAVAGVVLVISWVLLWVLAVLWSWARMRKNKIAFWVPILAGVLANLLLLAVVVELILHDPNLLHQLKLVVVRP